MRFELVVVGTSWGGLHALRTLLTGLPTTFPLAVAVVQHRSKDSDDTLVNLLQEKSALVVTEVEDKVPITCGRVYVAPPDYHTLVEPGFFALSIDEPVGHSRPSIDVLFETAAEAYGQRVIGLVMTGANHDGTRGLRRIKEAGGYALVQDPATAESPTMPVAALAGVAVDRVAPLELLPAVLIELAG